MAAFEGLFLVHRGNWLPHQDMERGLPVAPGAGRNTLQSGMGGSAGEKCSTVCSNISPGQVAVTHSKSRIFQSWQENKR